MFMFVITSNKTNVVVPFNYKKFKTETTASDIERD